MREGYQEKSPEEMEDLTRGAKWVGGAFGHIVNNLANPVVLRENVPHLAASGFGDKEKALLERLVNLPEYIKLKLVKESARDLAKKLGTSLGSVEMAEELLKRFENMPTDEKGKYNQKPYLK